MERCLLVHSGHTEVRAALIENGTPVEVRIERQEERGAVGNIYRGKIVRVLPGMQAAFVEIGLERTAFLYVNDALPSVPVFESNGENTNRRTKPLANIADVVSQGEEIIVQVQKDPMGTKGARLTRHVNLPGRFLVYMPQSEHIGVSRRIEDLEERERLKEILEAYDGDGGFIVRTAAEGIDEETLRREAAVLGQIWRSVVEKSKKKRQARLIFEDLDLALRMVRDLFDDSMKQVITNSAETKKRIQEFVKSFMPGEEARVELHEEDMSLFDLFSVDAAIERGLSRRVWLKSGGYIIIEQGEALTAIDVNSGRFVGKSNLEDTITQINLEAVREIAYQLRFRDIGGIVIIDLIDMELPENRERVVETLQECLKEDKATTTIVRMSEIGLVEMTRKRVRQSLGQLLTEPCSYCKARGTVKTEATVAGEILRALTKRLAQRRVDTILVNMEPSVADYLYQAENPQVEAIELAFDTQIIPVSREGFHRERYEIVDGAPK